MEFINEIKNKIFSGVDISDEEAYALTSFVGSPELRDAAKEVTLRCASRQFDTCSIINARSGRCPENCKWCAQSAHYKTGCDVYGFVGADACLEAAAENHKHGVGRFSIVTSGRAANGEPLDEICKTAKAISDNIGIRTCASLGLLDRDSLQKLWDAGVHRFHCNLETAPSFFQRLCSTHTIADKMATIEAAREIGFEICSGGIIGMGETMEQRVELALTLRKVRPVSIPINILCPIPGTPLENQPQISEDEIIDTVAIFRLIHPAVQLRFAGGRKRLSRDKQIEAMKAGINGAIVGDLLTTIGSTMAEDNILIAQAGYDR